MKKVFEKLLSVIKYYSTLVEKDPFIMLDLIPLNYKTQIQKITFNKYLSFISEYGDKYVEDISKCFLGIPKEYEEILNKAERSEILEQYKKNKGFKISDAKFQINPSSIFESFFEKQDFDKFKAANNYRIANFLIREKKYEEAQKVLEEALNYDPNNPYIINNVFLTNYLLGNFDKNEKFIELMLIFGINEIEFFFKEKYQTNESNIN